MKKIMIFTVVSISHYLLQFMSWASIVPAGQMEVGNIFWDIFSFPFIFFSTSKFLDSYFEISLIINSLIWGVASTLIMSFKERLQNESIKNVL